MRSAPCRPITAAGLRDASPGDAVQLEGVLRSLAPTKSVISGAPLVGYEVICSVFGEDGYAGKHEVVRWADAVLEDDSGEARIELDGAYVRAPALGETTLDDEDEVTKALAALGLEIERPSQIQLLERAVPDGARVTVRGIAGRIDPEARGAFRTSARPPIGLRSGRGAPIVIVPR